MIVVTRLELYFPLRNLRTLFLFLSLQQCCQKYHKQEKLHSCKFCQKSFKRRYAKSIHERIHTGEKPHSCNICDKSFGDPSTLVKHKKKQHNGKVLSSKNLSHNSIDEGISNNQRKLKEPRLVLQRIKVTNKTLRIPSESDQRPKRHEKCHRNNIHNDNLGRYHHLLQYKR